jgi:hemolysin activation/secretion protein
VNHRNHVKKIGATLAVALSLNQVPSAAQAVPQATGVIPPNPEQQGIPSIRREGPVLRNVPEQMPAETPPAAADQNLPSAITRIDLQAPFFAKEIEPLLQQFMGKRVISGRAIETVRGQIWDLYRQHGRMSRVDLFAEPGSEADGGSVMRVRVVEIVVRTVRVEREGEGSVDPALLDDILSTARTDIADGGVLDLDRLDSRIKRRLFLGDIDVRATLVPVDPTHVDVKLLVSAKPALPLGMLAQYDNNGTRTYDRNRYTAGVAIPGRMRAGDRLDLIGITSEGIDFGRVAYEFPVVSLGSRLALSGSHIEYKALPSGVKGRSSQLGASLGHPLHIGDSAVWIGYLDYAYRHQIDLLPNAAVTGDKRISSVQGKVDANYYLAPSQSLHFNAALIFGRLDLSALSSAREQDRISARTDGSFVKLEWGGGWSTLFGADGRLDARLEAKGQFANKNLDQSEKFVLGGPAGVRAYGSSEALGDDGYLANAEIGYRPAEWLRAFSFYDFGRIRRYHHPWVADSIPLTYALQGAGAGLSFSHQSLVGSVVYAHQKGRNKGLSATGQDSEGLTSRDRVWVSLTLSW